MNCLKTTLVIALILFGTKLGFALYAKPAAQEDIDRLKTDVMAGKLEVGKTRFKDVRLQYGDASKITDDDRRIIFDYGDLKLEFGKVKYLRNWTTDSFKKAVYTDDVDDLRADLEGKKIVGDNITFQRIRKDYGEPTEAVETDDDGNQSVYYYGDIRLTFENYIVLTSWRGANLVAAAPAPDLNQDLKSTKPTLPPPIPTPVPTPTTKTTPAATNTPTK